MCIPVCIRSFVTPLYDRLPTVIYRIWIRNNEGICNDISYHRWYLSEIKIKKKKIHKFKKLISSRNSKPFFWESIKMDQVSFSETFLKFENFWLHCLTTLQAVALHCKSHLILYLFLVEDVPYLSIVKRWILHLQMYHKIDTVGLSMDLEITEKC